MSLKEESSVIIDGSISNVHDSQTPGGCSDSAEQMARLNSPLIANLLNLMQALDLDALSSTTPEELHSLVSSRYRQALAVEAESDARRGELYGYDRLTTDTRGGRSIEWLARTGKVFSLGIASYCIAVGLFHKDIGLAGSHRNSNTVEDTMETLRIRLDLPKDLLINYGISGTKEERLQQVIQTAAQEAIEEFCLLSPNGIPAHGTNVFTYGLFDAQRYKLSGYDDVIEETIKSHRSIKERGVNLDFKSSLGAMGELVYAGNILSHNAPTLFVPYFNHQNSSV